MLKDKMSKMADDSMAQVSGAKGVEVAMEGPRRMSAYAASADSEEEQEMKKQAFQTVWEALGFTKDGRTSHERDELFEEWARGGFLQSALEFLQSKK